MTAMDVDEIRARVDALRGRDLPTHGGRTLAYVYDSGVASADVIGREVLAAFSSTNGLDPTAFPSLLQMENDLVAVAGRLVDAPPGFAGVATSGGTESILLAVLAARDARPEIRSPRMVLPTMSLPNTRAAKRVGATLARRVIQPSWRPMPQPAIRLPLTVAVSSAVPLSWTPRSAPLM